MRRATWWMTLIVGLIIVTSIGAALWVASLWAGSLVMHDAGWASLSVLAPFVVALTWIALPSIRRARSSIEISDNPFQRSNGH